MVETKKVKLKPVVKPVVKPKEPVVKSKELVVKPKEPVKPKKLVKPVKRITIEYQGQRDKYTEKIRTLIAKIKNQNTEIDHGIRFCWKN